MASQITITVNNKSTSNEAFQIFNAFPEYDGTIGNQYINVWGTAPEVDAQTGSTTFQITEQFYAICGNAPSALTKGLVISTENFETAQLTSTKGAGSNWKLDIPAKQAPIFTGADGLDSTTQGGFTINTMGDTWISTDYPKRYCGIGRDNPVPGNSGVVPVYVFPPDSNQTYGLTPKRVFYIATGSVVEGLAASVTDLGSIATIDFTGKTQTQASVDLTADFAWGPVSFSP